MAIVDLDREAVRAGLEDGTLLLVDVREPHEYAQGRIPGSVSYPLSGFDPATLRQLVEADGRRPVLSCAAGVRSARALAFAQAGGLALSEHYAGGFKDWAGAGEPVD